MARLGMRDETAGGARIERRWLWLAGLLAAHAVLLIVFRARFEHDRDLAEIPALWLAAGLVSAGVVYIVAMRAIARAAAPGATADLAVSLLRFVLVVGLALRVALLWSTPALEDDFYRYLWDGGVAVHGYNPYRYVPDRMGDAQTPAELKDLAESAGYVHQRINHAHLRTIYPPVAIAAFGVAHLAEAWSLLAWRLVCLAAEGCTLWLLLLILRRLGRSPLWIAIYWWNPLVMKELINSAHMEAVLVPLVLGALLLSLNGRHVFAVQMIGLAAATKIWPLLLAPLLLRPLLAERRALALALAGLGAIVAAAALPALIAGMDRTSGFVAYASEWRTSSALYPALEFIWRSLLGLGGLGTGEWAGRLTRAVMAVSAVAISLWLAAAPLRDEDDLVRRAVLVVVAVVLLSPAQFPWYLTWIMPLAVLWPLQGIVAATMLMPLYYVSFHFSAIDQYWLFRDVVVWAIWLPIWVLLGRELTGKRPSRS